MTLQTLPPAARDLARKRDRLTLRTRRAVAREWAGMGDRWDASWLTVGPRIVATVALAQRGAAAEAGGYVAAVVEQLGLTAPAEVAVNVSPLVGVASDGRALGGLVRQGLAQAKLAALAGASPRQALARGGAFLGLVSGLQVVDTLRVATGLHGAARNLGYVRMLSGGSCSRCIVLAGRWYRWSAGFDRHPGCDCVHVPAPESRASGMVAEQPEGVPDSPRSAWGVAPAGARALPGARPMPEALYRQAAGDRDEALRLLRVHGYVL